MRFRVLVYRTAFAAPWVQWNRYDCDPHPIGIALRIGKRHLLSIVWRKPIPDRRSAVDVDASLVRAETQRLRDLDAWDQEHRDAYLSLAQFGLTPTDMVAAGTHWIRASVGLPDPCPRDKPRLFVVAYRESDRLLAEALGEDRVAVSAIVEIEPHLCPLHLAAWRVGRSLEHGAVAQPYTMGRGEPRTGPFDCGCPCHTE